MLYVKRNQSGNIEALYSKPNPDSKKAEITDYDDIECFVLNNMHQEINEEEQVNQRNLMGYLNDSDRQMIRVIEDLIVILVDKNIIQFTDLPGATQEKILTRNNIRSKLEGIFDPDRD